jgi:outer membrane protein
MALGPKATRGGLRALAVVAFGICGTAQASAQTLTDTLIAAYRTSGLLEQNQATLRAADENVAQSVASLRPVLNYIGSAGLTFFNGQSSDNLSAGVSANWLLYDFGATRFSTDALKETVLATRAALLNLEQQVLLRGVATFLNVRRQEAFVALQTSNVRVLAEQVRASQDRFEVGEVTRTDVSIAEARLAAAQSSLAAAQGALAQEREEYNAVTRRFPGQLSPPPGAPATAASLEAARGVARRNHPLIRQAQHQVASSELFLEAAKAGLRPQLTANASIDIDQDGDDTESFGLQLSGPIYQGGAITSQIREAQANRDASRANLYQTALDVDQGVGNAWADTVVTRASLRASEEQVRAARLALRGGQQELEVGSRTTLDVLDLEQELLDAETNLISVEIDQFLADYTLLSAMGLLTVDHLKLGIVTYDPAAYYNAVKDAPGVNVSPQGERLDRILKSLNRK